jgi:hypothetical protein
LVGQSLINLASSSATPVRYTILKVKIFSLCFQAPVPMAATSETAGAEFCILGDGAGSVASELVLLLLNIRFVRLE